VSRSVDDHKFDGCSVPHHNGLVVNIGEKHMTTYTVEPDRSPPCRLAKWRGTCCFCRNQYLPDTPIQMCTATGKWGHYACGAEDMANGTFSALVIAPGGGFLARHEGPCCRCEVRIQVNDPIERFGKRHHHVRCPVSP
jgi:hypothetical protein